jgi:diguanylate cyclase (GGDEF)-like protein
MLTLRLSLDRPLHRDGDPYDDGPLPDFTSGLMWLASGAVGLAVQPLPGTHHEHAALVVTLCGFALAWGAISVVLGLRQWTMPLRTRALVTAFLMPAVALALWATGGANSNLPPLLLFTALFLGWFFPPRLAWPLIALFVAVYATPLLYDTQAVAIGYPARTAGFAVAVVGQAIAMQFLKRRLVWAELRQRRFAQLDPLTGVSNRRGFDAALARVGEREDSCALILFDLDDFKSVNDQHGHPAGDAVLHAVAHAAQGVVRHGDCLARIGGDEFAVIAPGAGRSGIMRLLSTLSEAVDRAPTPEGLERISITFAWALAPDDAVDGAGLFARADERLLTWKRARKRYDRRQRLAGAPLDEELAVALELDTVDDERSALT